MSVDVPRLGPDGVLDPSELDSGDWLSARQVASGWAVSTDAVDRRRRQGQLVGYPSRMESGRPRGFLYRRADVEASEDAHPLRTRGASRPRLGTADTVGASDDFDRFLISSRMAELERELREARAELAEQARRHERDRTLLTAALDRVRSELDEARAGTREWVAMVMEATSPQ